MADQQRAGEAFTWLCCPLCSWQSVEVPDIFRTQLTPDYQAHVLRAHTPRPFISQRIEFEGSLADA